MQAISTALPPDHLPPLPLTTWERATMSAHPTATSENLLRPELRSILDRQRAAFVADINPGWRTRNDRLARLDRLIERHADHFSACISKDYGRRSEVVTALTEIVTTRAATRHARRHLRQWMRPRRVGVGWAFRPGQAKIVTQPVGVVGIVGAWNFPLQLVLSPLVGALAAGNRAMLKPSEITPRFAEALKVAVADFFSEDEVAVVTGGTEAGAIFASLPFDHLIFTGSIAVGRLVAQAAARNLTPVTLEPGGKSPALVDVSANLAVTARRLVFGKLLNAGQICISPDYALVPRTLVPAFLDAVHTSVAKQYPSMIRNPDYTSIVNDRHFERIKRLIVDAETKGARIIQWVPADECPCPEGGTRILPPTVIVNATSEMAVMQEEIFGPVLPVIPYDTREEAIASINKRDRPLALYWFGTDDGARDEILARTISGGVTINDTIMHSAPDTLPFGGIGPSGIGHYHGKYGFRALSKEKPVFMQSRFSTGSMLYPPYGPFARRFLSVLSRFA